MRRSLSLIVVLALAVASPTLAGWDEGVAAFTSKNYQAAYQEFQQVAQQNPDGYRGHYMLGLACVQLGRKEEALTHLRKAYDLNPNDLSIKLALGRAYRTAKRYSEAGQLLSKVDPSSLPAKQRAAFYQIRGESRAKTKDTNGALSDFSQLAKLQPKNPQVQHLYGTMALAAGQVDSGLNALRTATSLAAGDEDVRKAYVNGLIRKGRMTRDKDAKKRVYLQAAEQAKALVGISGSYDNLLLKASAELGATMYTQAIDSGQKALAKKNSDWLVHYYLGQAYTSAGQFTEAEGPLNQARQLAKKPDDVKTVWKQLGFTYEKQKKYSQAIEAYQNAGDTRAADRVRDNEETSLYNSQVEAENERIRQMEAEAAALEEQLKALEGGGGGLR